MNTKTDSPVWDRLAPTVRERACVYRDAVRETIGPAAKSLTVFGAVLTDSFDGIRDSIRSALVVDRVDLSLLRRLADQGARLGKASVAAPLVLTPQYLRTSLDTFPLELIEIQQLHLTLCGEDPFGGLSFEDAHVRLQCEREIKRLLIGLAQGVLATGGRERLLPGLGREAGEALLRTLRGLLWLKGRREYHPAREVLTQVETVTGRCLAGLGAAFDNAARPRWAEFDRFYQDVEAVGEIVNAW